MQIKVTIFSFFSLIFINLMAQKDSAALEDVVVTATRSARQMGNVAVPVKLVTQKNIQQIGSLKLQDVLNEQTGLVVVNSSLASSLNGYPNPFGQGVQMLGLDPAYTAILLDGEPLVGRNAGILKLGRLAVGNIKQIEIVKGPSSSLYGSEAMAGVINILTDLPNNKKIDVQLHGASNNTFSGSIGYSKLFKKTTVQLFLNKYNTQGYDLDSKTFGKTVDPYTDINTQLKLNFPISNKLSNTFSIRTFHQTQKNNYEIYPFGSTNAAIVDGKTIEKDYSVFNQLKWNYSSLKKIYFRIFYNRYSNSAAVADNNGVTYDETSFLQHIIKPEIQIETVTKKGNKYIGGVGAYFESIDASRYAGKQSLQTIYTFSQKEWNFKENVHTIIAGLRLDKRSDFALNFSPRLAWAFKPNKKLKFTASVGSGFKAPDFRHMFLNLANQQIGYTLIGNNILYNQLLQMKQQGLLDNSSNINQYNSLPNLKPEYSIGFHLGASYTQKKLKTTIGIFRNEIENLIDVYSLQGVAKINGGNIFSYRNINRVYTQGLEIDVQYQLNNNWQLTGGYQYLIAKDKDIVEKINSGKAFYRDPITFESRLITKADYFGLPNRSRNTYNAKILFTTNNKKFTSFLRAIYRGQFGVENTNGKIIMNNTRDMIEGFWLVNFLSSYQFNSTYQIQIGCENLGNYTNVLQMPNIAGRLFFINFNYTFK